MNRQRMVIVATALCLVIQLAVIGSVIVSGNLTLSRGIECRFKASGYDPSDPLRGRYLRFTAEIRTENIDESISRDRWGQKAYFQFSETPDESGYTRVLRCASKPSNDGVWVGPVPMYIDSSLSLNDKGEQESWEDFMKRRDASPKAAFARLPEKFYVPEDKAPILEKNLQKNGAVAVYRVYKGKILLADLQVTDNK